MSKSAGLDSDWEAILSFLPNDWEEKARQLGAFTRPRGFPTPEALLRTLLLHLAAGCSLRETAIRAKRAGLCTVSDVAVLKRLRKAKPWLRYLAESLRSTDESARILQLNSHFNLCAVDASVVSEPGSTGSDWRLHYALDLANLSCRYFSLTDTQCGERLQNFPIKEGDLIIADRAYDKPPGISYAIQCGGDVLVRLKAANCPLLKVNGEKFNLLAVSDNLQEEETASWELLLKNKNSADIAGRVCVYRHDNETVELLQKKVRRNASKKQIALTENSLQAAKYVVLFTTAPENLLSLEDAFVLYRFRWQIEIAFKRLKSLTGFGNLPKYDEESCQAWLYGKIFVGLLAEKMMKAAFFP